MFRRLPNQLPRDPDYPSDLTKLGLFINSAHQLKQIDYPEDAYRFSVTTNERYNEVREEAVNNCLCEELVTRLSKLGVESLWLPSLSNDKPDVSDVPTLPVLATQLSKLRVAKRVIVVVGKLTEDLGVWNWKSVRGEAGVEAGTVISFVKDLMGRSFESKINEVEEDDGQSAEAANGTAFLMPNPGQLLYSYNHNSAMTLESWTALSRPSALHQAPLIDEKMNRVEGSETAEKHLNYVFEKVVMNKNFVSQDAKIFLVGLNDGADQLLKMLEENWTTYSTKLNLAAVALINTLPLDINTSPLKLENLEFISFLADRGLTWAQCADPINTPLANATTAVKLAKLKTANLAGDTDLASEQIHLTPIVSCGVLVGPEEVMSSISSAVLTWFEEVAACNEGDEQYVNAKLLILEEIEKGSLQPGWTAQNASGWSSEEPNSPI